MSEPHTMAPTALLRRVRLELARGPEHPEGSRAIGYDFIAPIDDKGHIVDSAYRELKERCRVRRFSEHAPDEVGHLIRKRGGAWSFHYDIHGSPDHDETGYRFDSHVFIPGEYISLREKDGELKTFRVISVNELD